MMAVVLAFFKALFEAILGTPQAADKEEYHDVGRDQPDNPDDIFDPGDFG